MNETGMTQIKTIHQAKVLFPRSKEIQLEIETLLAYESLIPAPDNVQFFLDGIRRFFEEGEIR